MMNATLIVSLVLGIGGGLSGVYAFVNSVRDRSRTVKQQEGDITLTSEQRNKIAAEAAQINATAAIAQQDWWQEQFKAVVAELEKERRWRRRVTRYIRNHEPWDELAEAKLEASGVKDMPPRPALDLDPEEE